MIGKLPANLRTPDTTDWASPQEVDALLGRIGRLEARLENRTPPSTWLMLGALGGVLYYLARRNIADERLTRAIENLVI